MRWKNKSSRRPYILDYYIAKEIIYDAYREGFINWNIFNKALGKIASNINGSWMFGQDWDRCVRDWNNFYYQNNG